MVEKDIDAHRFVKVYGIGDNPKLIKNPDPNSCYPAYTHPRGWYILVFGVCAIGAWLTVTAIAIFAHTGWKALGL